MIGVKEKEEGYHRFRRYSKSGEKVSKRGKTARETLIIDKEAKVKYHLVEEQNEKGEWARAISLLKSINGRTKMENENDREIREKIATSLARLPDIPKSKDLKSTLMLLLGRKHQFMTPDNRVKIFTWTPNEFRTMLETHGFQIEKIIGKGITMPLRISNQLFTRKKYSETLFNSILQFELALCDKPDALALAGHMQAIAHKK
jgi:hypothetical protein